MGQCSSFLAITLISIAILLEIDVKSIYILVLWVSNLSKKLKHVIFCFIKTRTEYKCQSYDYHCPSVHV